MRMNGLYSHSSPIVEGSRWPGWMRVSGGSFISLSITEDFRSAKPVAPGARVPPTVPLKSTSAVSTSVSLNAQRAVVGAVAGRVHRPRSAGPPVSITSPSAKVSSTLSSISSSVSWWARIGAPKRSASLRAPTTWS